MLLLTGKNYISSLSKAMKAFATALTILSRFIYDENDEILVSKGGYMPTSKKFTSLYKNIKEILAAYDINQIVDAHREILSVE